MRLLPSLNSTCAFEAVARYQNFTLAARELPVTVAEVSHLVRQLESHNVDVLDPSPGIRSIHQIFRGVKKNSTVDEDADPCKGGYTIKWVMTGMGFAKKR